MTTQFTLRSALIAIISVLLIGCSSEESVEPPAAAETEVDAEAALIERAMAIHDRVLTLDSHADTPLRMIEPGFDMAERHDPRETGSKFDYPRMIEGGLDSVFFSAFVAQGIRDDEGNTRARDLAIQMLDAVVASADASADQVGIAWNPDDAYALEQAGKRAVYLSIENGYPIGGDIANVEMFFDKGVRYITLVHSTNNDLADSSTDSN